MFTAATITAVASFLGGDLLMLLVGRLAPPTAVKAGVSLVKILRIIEANGEHLPEGVRRQIADEARASGQASKASILQGWVRSPYSMGG